MIQVKSGDVFLTKVDENDFIFSKVSSILKNDKIPKLLVKLSDYRYNHAGMILHSTIHPGYIWCLEAIEKGVWLTTRPLKLINQSTIIRYNRPYDNELVVKSVLKDWNKGYDAFSLIQNAFVQLSSAVGFDGFFRDLLSKRYDNQELLICSELVARAFVNAGYEVGHAPEFKTPTDLLKSEYFKTLKL